MRTIKCENEKILKLIKKRKQVNKIIVSWSCIQTSQPVVKSCYLIQFKFLIKCVESTRGINPCVESEKPKIRA